MTADPPRWTGPPEPPERPGPAGPGGAAPVGPRPDDVARDPSLISPAPTGSDVVWAFAVGMGGMVVGAVVVVVPLLVTLGVGYAGAFGLLGASVGAGLGLWVALVRRRGWGWRELGFVRSHRSSWQLVWQVPTALLVGLLCTATLGPLLGLTPDAAGADTQPDLFDDALLASPWLVVIALLCVVVLLPAAEEVVFRRVLLGWLLTRTPVVVAVVLASLVFAAVHVLPVAVLYLSFLGVSANLLYLWHRSLWAPLVLHAVNNAVASLVAFAALSA